MKAFLIAYEATESIGPNDTYTQKHEEVFIADTMADAVAEAAYCITGDHTVTKSEYIGEVSSKSIGEIGSRAVSDHLAREARTCSRG